MNLKNFIIGTVAAFVVNFVLGGVFYQVLFPNLYPATEHNNMVMPILGGLFSSMMFAYVFDKFAGAASTLKSAGITGAMISLLSTLSMNFYMYSNKPFDMNHVLTEAFIAVVMGGCVGIAIWFAVSKFGSKAE
jgi:hypothetical protein